MFCSKCGAPLEEGQYYCPQCWTVVVDVPPKDESASDIISSHVKRNQMPIIITLFVILGIAIMITEAVVIHNIIQDKQEAVFDVDAELVHLFDTYAEAVNTDNRYKYVETFEITSVEEDSQDKLTMLMKEENELVDNLSYEILGWRLTDDDAYLVTVDLNYQWRESDTTKEVDFRVVKKDDQLYLTEWVCLYDRDADKENAKIEELFADRADAIAQNSPLAYMDSLGYYRNKDDGYLAEAFNEIEFIESMSYFIVDVRYLDQVEAYIERRYSGEFAEVEVEYYYEVLVDGESLYLTSHCKEMMLRNDFGDYSYSDVHELVLRQSYYSYTEQKDFEERMEYALDSRQEGDFRGLFYITDESEEGAIKEKYYYMMLFDLDTCRVIDSFKFAVPNKDSIFYREGLTDYYIITVDCEDSDTPDSYYTFFAVTLIGGKYYILPVDWI